jgi:mitochondrial import inner membrane translocase subunit TIM50
LQNSSPIPPTYLEQKRKEAQRQYKDEQAYIESHKEEFERLLQQDQHAMAKEVPNNLWEAFSAMAEKKPTTAEDKPPSAGDLGSSTGGASGSVDASVSPSRT